MNIEEAKSEIRNALKVYLIKDSHGNYEVPVVRQRPIMVIGAPGIGKSAIMEQLAAELKLGLVSYTITHHTRQSAIGLPYISKRIYNGKEIMVTEYTMSEIITTVYDAIEKQHQKEGILFIDEINCVSETLAPAMLDLLQNKKFGPHCIPNGWILVAAGNPPEYNRSAREFDVVTLDRLKVLNVEPEFDIWEKYAYKKLLHNAIIYYLSLKKQNLFKAEKTVIGYNYVTPRGWEDLSVAMQKYEQLGIEITLRLVEQYISDKKTSSEFYNYYILYTRYRTDYNVKAIMEGKFGDIAQRFAESRFDEKLGIISVFSGAINQECESFCTTESVLEYLKQKQEEEKAHKEDKLGFRQQLLAKLSENADKLKTAEEQRRDEVIEQVLEKIIAMPEATFKEVVNSRSAELKAEQVAIRKHVENLFTFIDSTFGKGQEMVSFVLNLVAGCYFVHYISSYPCPVFFDYNELLLVDKQNKLLLEEIAKYRAMKDN